MCTERIVHWEGTVIYLVIVECQANGGQAKFNQALFFGLY